ncbi:ABC transporter permease [Streptomyces hirsutus]
MSAVTDAVRIAAPGNPIGQSIRDSLIVARTQPDPDGPDSRSGHLRDRPADHVVVLFSYVFGGSMNIGGTTARRSTASS